MEICTRIHRPRQPRQSPLFQLLELLYDTVKGVLEERFEARYGFWRGRWDDEVIEEVGRPSGCSPSRRCCASSSSASASCWAI